MQIDITMRRFSESNCVQSQIMVKIELSPTSLIVIIQRMAKIYKHFNKGEKNKNAINITVIQFNFNIFFRR